MNRRAQRAALLSGVVAMAAGCNWTKPLAFLVTPQQRIPAEFDKLAGGRVAVLVWVDASTLFDYPHARFELATYVGDRLAADMAQRKHEIGVVDPRDVEDFVQKNPSAQINPDAVGKKLDVDYVIYLEVVKFQMRDPNQPQFLQGLIEASVAVVDVRADADTLRRFDLVPVKCLYPDGAPVPLAAENAARVREATYRKFAELVARKFYDYAVET